MTIFCFCSTPWHWSSKENNPICNSFHHQDNVPIDTEIGQSIQCFLNNNQPSIVEIQQTFFSSTSTAKYSVCNFFIAHSSSCTDQICNKSTFNAPSAVHIQTNSYNPEDYVPFFTQNLTYIIFFEPILGNIFFTSVISTWSNTTKTLIVPILNYSDLNP